MVVLSIHIQGQVTIGSEFPPEKAALLDIKSQNSTNGTASSTLGGILLPRVALLNLNDLSAFTTININASDYAQQKLRHKGLMVYNVNVSTTNNLEEGVYIWNGTVWQKAGADAKAVNWFYMPSIEIQASQVGNFTVELHQEYLAQFQSTPTQSPQAPPLPVYTNASDLYYYVTGYDANVFENIQITNTGSMTYRVKNAAKEGSSYINIVLMAK